MGRSSTKKEKSTPSTNGNKTPNAKLQSLKSPNQSTTKNENLAASQPPKKAKSNKNNSLVFNSSKSFNTSTSSSPSLLKNNSFRAEHDFQEKPRQFITLGILLISIAYYGFSRKSSTDDLWAQHIGKQDALEEDIRAIVFICCFIFLTFCFLQLRDSVLLRPHPGVWRIVHGIGMLHLLFMSILLVNNKAGAQWIVKLFFPDIHELQKKEEAEPQSCALTFSTFIEQLKEPWIIAHSIGWWGKMLMFRDWKVCWVLSLLFELIEMSLGFMIPQFTECWWDSLFLDFLGANLLGMIAGWYTLKVMESRVFDWSGTQTLSPSNKVYKFVSRLSPYSFTKYRWHMLSSIKRFFQVLVLLFVCLMMEVNAFLLLNALNIPKDSAFNKVRLLIVFLVALPCAAEYYEYINSTSVKRLGPNVFVMAANMMVEILVWGKFWDSDVSPAPSEVQLPWVCFSFLFLLYLIMSYALSDELGIFSVFSVQRKLPDKATLEKTEFLREALDFLFLLSFFPLIYLMKQWVYN